MDPWFELHLLRFLGKWHFVEFCKLICDLNYIIMFFNLSGNRVQMKPLRSKMHIGSWALMELMFFLPPSCGDAPSHLNVLIFSWLAIQNKILIRQNLIKQNFYGPFTCKLCGKAKVPWLSGESLERSFPLIIILVPLWYCGQLGEGCVPTQIEERMGWVIRRCIWQERRNRVFNKKKHGWSDFIN